MPTIKYLEHEKLEAVKDASQAQGELLEWLLERVLLCEWQKNHFIPIYRSIEDWLAEFHGIDLKKLEAEKRLMVEAMRTANERSEDGQTSLS